MTKGKPRKAPRPSKDEIRLGILRLLYHERVKSGTRKRYLWSKLRAKIRSELEFTPAETTHNLDYLIQNGLLEKETEPYTGPRSRSFGTERELYGLSAKAIDLFEGDSMFSAKTPVQEIVVAGDQNIVQVGPNTYAYVQYQNLQSALNELLQAVILSEELSSEKKVEAIAEVKTIQAQLMKREPDKTLMNRLKEALGPLANVAGISNFLLNVLRHWPF